MPITETQSGWDPKAVVLESDGDSEDSGSDGSKHGADEKKFDHEGVNATRGMKVFDNSSSNGEPGMDSECEAILNEEKGSDKNDTSDVERIGG
ncbi:hypothetical protein HOY82DRAFT_614455 [Tuber indicum]|nr:hypothetical protein HOY82DRAFT_614455 [Tuber indicum]